MSDPERLTPRQVRKLNKTYTPVGLRVCRVHQGHPLPLTDDYFYRIGAGNPRFETICKACKNAAKRERKYERYHHEPGYAEHIRQVQKRWRLRNCGHVRLKKRDAWLKQKSKRFEGILAQNDRVVSSPA